MSIKVVIIDDQQLFLEGITVLLEQQEDIEVVRKYGNEGDLSALAEDHSPQVMIVNTDMANFNAIECFSKVLQNCIGVKIIALTTYHKRHFVREMFQAGVSGMLLKQNSFEELLEAIRTVTKDQVYLSQLLAGVMVDRNSNGTSAQTEPDDQELTEREYDVIRLLSEGKSSKEIANHINMSVQTVDACRREILKKLNLDSMAQLVKYAIREGLTGVEC
ncbi:MAG: response regulator transcription factor [Planctomycetes bacterium]|nr:response regulator transcription factor [Planctomycetota bacterium]